MVRLFNYNYTEKLYHLYFNNLFWNLSIKISGAKHEHFCKRIMDNVKQLGILLMFYLVKFAK